VLTWCVCPSAVHQPRNALLSEQVAHMFLLWPTGMVPLLFLNTKKKKQLKQQELIRDVCTLVSKHATALGCDDVVLFVAHPQAATSPDRPMFTMCTDGTMREYLPVGSTSPVLTAASPIGRPERVSTVTAQQAAWLTKALQDERFLAGLPVVVSVSTESCKAAEDGAVTSTDGVVVVLPVLDEKGGVLGAVQLARYNGDVDGRAVHQARAMASHVACVLRNWVDAATSDKDDDDEDSPAGIASAKQLELSLALCFRGWSLST
jgi:hypothetical protein